MSAFTASSTKPWVLDSKVSSHMIGIKDKFHSLSFNNNLSPVNIADDTSFTVYDGVFHATALYP